MTQPDQTFEDPTLKAALKSALGGETAPAGLRDRIRAALDEVESSVESRRPERRMLLFRSPLVGVAVAALVVIAIGLAVKFYGSSGGGPRKVANLPEPIAKAMVAVHTSTNAGATSPLASDDATKLEKVLSDELGYRALVPNLGSDWVLRDAKIAMINGWKSAQAVYTRGDQSISLFTIPAGKAYSPEDGATYEVTVDRHPIAGFVRGKSMHCAVASEGVKMDDLKAITDALLKS